MRSRTVLLSAWLCIIAFAAICYMACKKPAATPEDPCKTVHCENGGTCEGGECNCDPGFSGAKCETRWVEKYLGQWVVLDSSADGFKSYIVNIRPSATEPAMIVIDSFWIYKANNILVDLLNENSLEFRPEQNVYPGFHENYILAAGSAIKDTTGIRGSFVISHTGEPNKLHAFSMNR